jgi:hypothetical protein
MKPKKLQAISLRGNKPFVSRCDCMAMEILGNFADRADKLAVCLVSVLGVTFRVSVFLQRFKVHRADMWHLRNNLKKKIFFFFIWKRRSSGYTLRCLLFIKYLKSGSILGQKFVIRLGVTPRRFTGDKVNMLYTFSFMFSEVNCSALQPASSQV